MTFIKKLSKRYLFTVSFMILFGFTYGQDYIAPTIHNPNGATIKWKKDGSVIVTGGPVTFTSGIRQAQENISDQISAIEMMLVDETAFNVNEEDYDIDYGIHVNNLPDEYDDDAVSNVFGTVKMGVYRRLQEEDGTFNSSTTNNYGYEFDDDGLVYGIEYPVNRSNPVSWDVFAYVKSGLNWNATVKSTDYKKLLNRPHNVSRWWVIPDVIGIVIVVMAAIYFVIYTAFAAGVAGTQLILNGWGLGVVSAKIYAVYAIATVLGGMTLLSLGLSTDQAINTHADLSGRGISPQVVYSSHMEIEVPAKIGTGVTLSKEVNREIDKLSKHAEPCSFDNTKNCVRRPFMTVVVQVEVTDAQIHTMSIPGSIYRKRTPFQVFRSYYYESDYNDVDRTSGEISSSISLVTEPAVDNFNDFIGLPPTIAYTNSEASVSLEFNDFNGLPYFYLVHTSEPVVSSEAYGNPNIGHALCLGKFGKRISSNTDYYLYRYQAIITENGSPLVVDIPLGPEGPFLAGDNIFFDNPAAHMDIVIANGSNQVIFKDDTGVVQEVAELTVNGDVLIFDPNDKDNQSPLVATENWQFYVGAKGNAVGIVAENFAITGRDSYLLPDFVFAPDYPLNSLAEMELHIKENKHLPHVPSQKDVDKEGFYSIDHMINGQLQNLEELYLHAFQQEEKIKQHQASAKLFGERLRIIQQSLEKLENQNENE